MYDGVEEFLQSQNNLMPIRYSYSEIRKITKVSRINWVKAVMAPYIKERLKVAVL